MSCIGFYSLFDCHDISHVPQVFHWHITDSQSFPLRLDSAPELAEHGAYIFNGRRLVYTKKDVKRIVQYAKERGIRVIPEIDMVRPELLHSARDHFLLLLITVHSPHILDPGV